MDTFEDAVAELQSAEAGGFDVSPARAASLTNEGVKRLASLSEWIRAELELGPTVVGQEEYVVPGNVVRVRQLAVGGVPYSWTDLLTLWEVKMGKRTIVSSWGGGIFADRFSPDGKTEYLALAPVPTVAGQPITGLAAIEPADLAGKDKLPFPPEFRRGIVDFAKAIGYETIDENLQSANALMQRATATALELREQARARSGSGPWRIPVASLRRR